MSRLSQSTTAQLVGELVLVGLVVAAFAIGDSWAAALSSGAVLLAFVAFLHLGRRRSQTVEVMGGIGDERTRALYTRTMALTGSVMALVLPAWWLVRVAQGHADDPIGMVCAVYGVTFIVSSIVISRRG